MKKPNGLIIFIIIFVLAVAGMIYLQKNQESAPGEYDALAQCIADSGAKFYGAFWCPHCQDQHKLFGNSDRLLPYVECSTPDGQSQTQVCEDAGITSYPTWVLADGTELGGVQQIETLADATGCSIN